MFSDRTLVDHLRSYSQNSEATNAFMRYSQPHESPSVYQYMVDFFLFFPYLFRCLRPSSSNVSLKGSFTNTLEFETSDDESDVIMDPMTDKNCENGESESYNHNMEDLLFIKHGMTYHLYKNGGLTPISSCGTQEANSDDELEDYINDRYSRSVSSPY